MIDGRPSRTWGICRPVVGAADRVEHRENGMIRVAMTYRLCSPPLRFWTVSANSMYEECSGLNLRGFTWRGPFKLRVVLLPQAMAGKAANLPPASMSGRGLSQFQEGSSV